MSQKRQTFDPPSRDRQVVQPIKDQGPPMAVRCHLSCKHLDLRN